MSTENTPNRCTDVELAEVDRPQAETLGYKPFDRSLHDYEIVEREMVLNVGRFEVYYQKRICQRDGCPAGVQGPNVDGEPITTESELVQFIDELYSSFFQDPRSIGYPYLMALSGVLMPGSEGPNCTPGFLCRIVDEACHDADCEERKRDIEELLHAVV